MIRDQLIGIGMRQIYQRRIPQWSFSNFKQIIMRLGSFCLLLVLLGLAHSLHIESKKYTAFSGQLENKKIDETGTTLPIIFDQPFDGIPEVGLSVYNFQFSYNPNFAVRVKGAVSSTGFTVEVIGTEDKGVLFNEIYIMIIASDLATNFGIYRIQSLNTSQQLGDPSISNPGPRRQVQTYNFKSVNGASFFGPSSSQANIRVLAFMTGLNGQSETIANGYATNKAYFALTTNVLNKLLYEVIISIQDNGGDILIKSIEFTILYYDIVSISTNYQMNSGSVDIRNFGGTFFKSSISVLLAPLPYNKDYETQLSYFFGVNKIYCSEGDSINLLAVEAFNYNQNGRLQNLQLIFETQRNTYIIDSQFQYLQYKSLCTPEICGALCNQTSVYQDSANNCAPCFYTCELCSNSFECDTCPATRVLVPATKACVCRDNTFYDNLISKDCIACFKEYSYCKTCAREDVCIDCYTEYNFTKNPVLRTCQCSPGTYNTTVSLNANDSSIIRQVRETCALCPLNCIYCKSETSCEACAVPTYLAPNGRKIGNKYEACAEICNSQQIFSNQSWKCSAYSGDASLFNENGRLGFDWGYTSNNNELIVDILFSQRNVSYFFYENGPSYYFENSESQTRNSNGESNLFYDDGRGYIDGYLNDGGNQFASSVTTITNNNGGFQNGNAGSGFALFDESAMRGEYYGLGEATFFRNEYEALARRNAAQSYRYTDKYGIPFGKHQLANETNLTGLQLIDAVRNNLDFTINGVAQPYTIKAISGNQLQMIVRPEKSYLTSDVALTFKNPALVRVDGTALQTPTVTKQIDRLDFYTASQLRSAEGLRDRAATIIQILWGICKYLLFIGLGWPVMPLMMVMQYIMGHNYINTQLPLNLDYFLTSFADFRNPSILFNPQRNDFDRKVVNHKEIYQRVSAFEEFDRGIDFMKNSFQFFFVPLLSFGLLFLFMGINKLINVCAKRDVPVVSNYLQPRIPLHVGAYTLVQALPISFFFFGQLKDTRYQSLNQPNSVYPKFNTGMAYAAFFASAIIPLILLTFIYNYFKKKSRTGVFSLDKFKNNPKGNFDHLHKDPASLGDPLWSGNPTKTTSYGFGAYIFYLPLLVGFFLAYFTKAYAWQLVGLILGFLGLLAFAGASKHFTSKVPKYYFAATGGLMVAYELVHAGVGSNRALSTYDQWNTGYLGIGIIFALLLIAILFTIYLLIKAFRSIYDNHIKPRGCMPRITDDNKVGRDEMNPRLTVRENQRRVTAKNSAFYPNPLDSEERMYAREAPDIKAIDESITQREPFLFMGSNNGRATYRAQNSGSSYEFPFWSSQLLSRLTGLTIDSQRDRRVFSGNDEVGAISYLKREREDDEEDEENMYMAAGQGQTTSYRILSMGGQDMSYQEDEDGMFVLRNSRGDIHQRINSQKLIEIMQSNGARVQYNGREYEMGSDADENSVWLVNAQNRADRQRISRTELMALLAARGNAQQRATSIIPSRKTVLSSDEEGGAMFQKARVIQSSSRKQIYVFNGEQCEKVGESADTVTFFNTKTKKTFTRTKKELEESLVEVISQQRISQQQISQGSRQQQFELQNLGSQAIYSIQGQNYQIVGRGVDGSYQLVNVSDSSRRLTLSEEQFLRLTGAARNVALTQSHQVVKRKLVYVNMSEDGNYMMLDEQGNQVYEVPADMVTHIEEVYIDEGGNIWHQNERLELESEEEVVEYSRGDADNLVEMRREKARSSQNIIPQSYNSFPSSATYGLDLSRMIQPDHQYQLLFFSGEHKFKDEYYNYEEHDVLHEERVAGYKVEERIAEVKRKIPNAKIIIKNETSENASVLFLEGDI